MNLSKNINTVNSIIRYLKIFVSFCLIVWILYLTGIGCPIKFITGISCPACGMTRAVLAILGGDFSSAFNYHPLIFVMPLLLIGILVYLANKQNIEAAPRLNRILNYVFIFFAILFIVVYVLRMINPSDTVVTFTPSQSLLNKFLQTIL